VGSDPTGRRLNGMGGDTVDPAVTAGAVDGAAGWY
jgi:hypothetical protein